jgi:uncharacterized membrane protein (UPF0127 family)
VSTLDQIKAPQLRLRNQTRGTILCANAIVAQGIRGRSRGLMGKSQIAHDEGMLFEAGPLPLMWMHTFFMAFPIDIVFLDKYNRVTRIVSALKPWRLSALVFGARQAIELAAGVAAGTETAVGDLIVSESI